MAVDFSSGRLIIFNVFSLVIATGAMPSTVNLLSLTVTPETSNWEANLTGEIPIYYTSEIVGSLYFRCEAPFPITWNLTGFINPIAVWIGTPKRIIQEKIYPPTFNIFRIRASIDIDENNTSNEAGASIRVICESVDDSAQQKEVLVFARDENQSPFVLNSDQIVIDSTIIPCSTKDPFPTEAPQLFRRDETGNDIEVTSVSYHPTEGFKSAKIFDGIYICKQGSYSNTITANVSGEYTVTPILNIVLAFSDDFIKLTCISRSNQSLEIIISEESPGSITSSPNNGNGSASVVIIPNSPNMSKIKGSASCLLKDDLNAAAVKEWQFEFMPPPQLDFKYANGGVSCLVNDSPKVVQSIRCDNLISCNFRSRCLKNMSDCGNAQQISSKDTRCREQKGNESRSCVSLPYIPSKGSVQCTVRGVARKWNYFVSVASLKYYTDWHAATTKELVQWIELEPIHSNRHIRLSCVSAIFLFANNLYFELEFEEGYTQLLEHDGVKVNISEHIAFSLTNNEAVLEIEPPTNAIAIHCHAPWWNSTETVKATWKVPPRNEPVSEKRYVIYVTVSVVAFVVICGVSSFLVYRANKRYKGAQRLLRSLTDKELEEFFHGRPEFLTNTATVDYMGIVEFLPYDTDYEVSIEDLKFDGKLVGAMNEDRSTSNYLGRGEFSNVVRGKLISKAIQVAVKMPKSSADVTLFKSLLSEVKIMIYIGQHENVLALIGVCTEDIRNCSIYIVTEVCELGSLDLFLRKARPSFINLTNGKHELDKSLLMFATGEQSSPEVITTLDLIKFAGQIANGMDHLSSKSVIHADLAARNVLLTENKTIKISDFGLSKKLYENKNYVKATKTLLPWRWMALESLNTLSFSTASDVWAYGVTLFEMFTLGDRPFPNEDWDRDFSERLEEGLRMSRPKYCTSEIYTRMLACWENEPYNRPSFATLKTFFEEMANEYLNDVSSTNRSTDSATVQTNTNEQPIHVGWLH